jgi:hypothetical protein
LFFVFCFLSEITEQARYVHDDDDDDDVGDDNIVVVVVVVVVIGGIERRILDVQDQKWVDRVLEVSLVEIVVVNYRYYDHHCHHLHLEDY